jgi:putative peptide zinc metalloprotease protein
MQSAAPRFRRDVTLSRQGTDGDPTFILKHPVSGEFFRLRGPEQFIAQQFDGTTPLEAVRRRTEEQFGATLKEETLRAFVERLDRYGLLEHEGTGAPGAPDPPGRQQGRLRGSLLYLRFKAYDPSRVFDRLIRHVGFVFTPQFMLCSGAIIALAVWVTVSWWEVYTHELSRLYRFQTIPLLLVLSFLVVSAHEIAHGLTCRRFGGRVREVGFMLIYFQPALYCNVSDAWLFPKKSSRLWVSFAGPYCELFLWALATLAWRVTDAGTLVNDFGLIVMTSSGLKTLLNFNPLIKLDGYYLLSDYLDIPNLRRRSFRYVGRLTQRVFGTRSDVPTGVSRREKRIYLTYGLAATLGSFAILGYIALSVGDLLIASGQPLALFLFTGLIGARFQRRFRKLFGGASDPCDPDDDGGDAPLPEAGVPTRPARRRSREGSRKRARVWIRRLIWSAVAVAGLAFVFLYSMELRIAGPFYVRPVAHADVRPAIEGLVDAVLVDEGDEVRAGQLVARLSDTALRAELVRTEAERREVHANLALLRAGATPQEIEVARASIAKAEDQLAFAESRVTRFTTLSQRGLVPRKELEDHEELATASRNTLAEARARLEALVTSVRPEQIEAMSARAQGLETHRAYLEGQLQLLTVVSPTAGVVATPSRELRELRGRLVKKGDLIATVFDIATVTAYILVSEKEIADVHVGQRVVLRARAYPSLDFNGTVTSVATSARASSASASQTPLETILPGALGSENRAILVTTEIQNQDLLLKPEMTGQAKIFGDERRVVDLITRRLARTVRVEFWSWW